MGCSLRVMLHGVVAGAEEFNSVPVYFVAFLQVLILNGMQSLLFSVAFRQTPDAVCNSISSDGQPVQGGILVYQGPFQPGVLNSRVTDENLQPFQITLPLVLRINLPVRP